MTAGTAMAGRGDVGGPQDRQGPSSWLIRGASPLGGEPADILVSDGIIADTAAAGTVRGAQVLDASGLIALPGLVDLHAHLREPGREDAETVRTGTAAAALGGSTAVHAMANTDPVADTAGVVEQIWRLGRQAGRCDVQPIGAVTAGLAGRQLAELGAMADSAARVRFVAVGGQRGTGSALLLPMLIEQLLELTHRRSRDLKVGVVPGLVRALLRLRGRSERAALVGGTEIDAADDCDPAVGQQQLAMVAVIEREVRGQRIDRIESLYVYAGGNQAVEELPWRRYRADAVVNHIDLHAAALPRDQQIAELLAIVLDLLEGVVLQVQIALCRVNGGEGRRKRILSIPQDRDLVAGKERRAGHSLLDGQMAFQGTGVRGLGGEALE